MLLFVSCFIFVMETKAQEVKLITVNQLESRFKQGEFEAGVIEGIQSISQHLEQYSSKPFVINNKANRNELSDKPVML